MRTVEHAARDWRLAAVAWGLSLSTALGAAQQPKDSERHPEGEPRATESFAASITVAPCPRPASEQLVGFWEQVLPDGNGLVAWIFRTDGSIALGAFFTSGGTYEIEGHSLRRKQTRGMPGPKPKPSTWAVEGETLIETVDGGTTTRKQRSGGVVSPQSPLVGTWRFHSQPGSVTWERFRADGTWELRQPMYLHHGCYALAGDVVRLTFSDGRVAPPVRATIRGDELKLAPQVPGEEPNRLTRQPEPWELPAQTGPSPLPTLPGPEASDLLPRVRGKLVVAGRRELEVIALPSLARSTLKVDSYFWGGDRYSEPDINGRLAFFHAQRLGTKQVYQSNLGGKLKGELTRYTLVSIGIDGLGARELLRFESPRLDAVGRDLELSSRGRRIAYLRDVDYVHVKAGKLINPVGIAKLRLFDSFWLERTLDLIAVGQLPEGGRLLAWHPDERRLAYVTLVERSAAEPERARLGEFGREFFDEGWEKVPQVRLLNVETNQDVTIGLGADLFFSDDGRKLVLGDTENRWRTVDLASGASLPLELPGNWRGPIALLENGLILYLANPTAGQPQEFSKAYSPLATPRALGNLKILDPATGRYQTLLPEAGRYRFRASP